MRKLNAMLTPLVLLNNDRFIVTDAALLQDSLAQGLGNVSNRQDAVFAAITLDRLRSDGGDLQAANDAIFDLLERGVA